ncbi:hypothetical protein FJQ98_06525 [Lysinibacillus agricola]|uniref:O-antigen ligase-related domain-containing protein n=1 Tax=Lysinibacillus agricola TaxID=2590012 RepID=A0ABX7AW20_9BACI|nr:MULTISPECIES: O-antigen ligase family protein [Lysinibacillus]KOS62732.1 hypothetical protein AN161_10440 [Lysinibacillus sp. FJAT-14222]QQP13702.1 hypothetical protein FJQ98_06525 [Lysinibacillus agricola]
MDQNKKEHNIMLDYTSCIILFFTMILAPYSFIGFLSMSSFILIMFSFLVVFFTKKFIFNKYIVFLFTGHVLLSLFVIYFTPFNIGMYSMYKSIIASTVILFCTMQLIRFITERTLVIVSYYFVAITGIFLLYQVVWISAGKIPFDGQLFSNLASGYEWATSVTYRRPNVLFSEPSYFAIFLLPILGLYLNNGKIIASLICLICLFVSTSSLGILGGVLIFTFYIIKNKKYKLAFQISTFTILGGILLAFLLDWQWIFTDNMRKISNINDESGMRLVGYIDYFFELPFPNQLIGVGFHQLANYFRGYDLYNYSNSFVLLLINHGIIGLLLFIVAMVFLFFKSNGKGQLLIFLFLIIAAVDGIIYGGNFFYVLTFIMLNFHKKEGSMQRKISTYNKQISYQKNMFEA